MTRNYSFLSEPKFLPPNGPELSCGGEQPVHVVQLRGRIADHILIRPTTRGEIVDGYFRQLERLVRRAIAGLLLCLYQFNSII